MSRVATKRTWCGLVVVLMGLLSAAAMAQGAHPFGVPERGAVPPSTGFFGTIQGHVSYWQSHFYRQLTGAVRAWQAGGGAGVLIALSFAYGVFHALGPGHGKAVIASYVVANRQTARNGALLALVASLVQALVAIVLVSVLGLAFNVTAQVMNEATRWLEAGAYAMVTGLGLWLVWRKVCQPLFRRGRHAPAEGDRRQDTHGHGHGHSHSHSDSHGHSQGHEHEHSHQHGPSSGHDRSHTDSRGHGQEHDHSYDHSNSHDHGECCGHSHAPDAEEMRGPLTLGKTWGAVLAVGLRPCSGAIIVLVFALAQDFYAAGIAAALAMGVGTGLTVASLAVLSAWGRTAAINAGRVISSRVMFWLRYAIEAVAALAVLAFGLLLLSASL